MNEVVNIRLVHLNNKSRKGLYVYVKAKSQRGAYYKFDQQKDTVDLYTTYYKSRYLKKSKIKRITEFKKKWDRSQYYDKKDKKYRKDMQKAGTLEHNLKRGISSSTIKNVLDANTQMVNKSTFKMFSKVVRDQDLLKIIASEQNLQKVKFRLSYNIEFRSKDGLLARTETFNKTPHEVVNELKNRFHRGERIALDLTQKLADKFNNLKYTNPEVRQGGNIESIVVRMKFVKGR